MSENPTDMPHVQITIEEGCPGLSRVPVPSLVPMHPPSPTYLHHSLSGLKEEAPSFPESVSHTVFVMEGVNADADHEEYLTSLVSDSDTESVMDKDGRHSTLVCEL